MAPHIGLLVSGPEALADYNLFVATLELWHPDAVLYIYADSDTHITNTPKRGAIHVNQTALDKYKGKRRSEMEAKPGTIYDSLFKDYTYEKANVINWMFETQKEGIWFMDADIIHCAPLPSIPDSATIALSPHYIRATDEAKFGHFNAGYMWFKHPEHIEQWTRMSIAGRKWWTLYATAEGLFRLTWERIELCRPFLITGNIPKFLTR